MTDTVGDFVLKRLHQWGVERIYGYPGDGINGIVGALDRQSDIIEFVQSRHEEMSAFMAGGHAKFGGGVGVCLATSGPGAIHLLNGLYDAQMDHQPVVAIVGQQKTTALGSQYQQEVDLVTLFKDVAHQYVTMVTTPAATRHAIDRAVRIARAERTVTCVIIPNDIQEMEMEDPPRAHGSTFSGVGWSAPRVVPSDQDLMRAAEVLNAGEKVAILIGAGALGAAEEVKRVADLLGAGVAKALLGRTALADDLPYVTGAIGLLGTEPSWDMMQECDTLLMIGTGFPYSEFLPEEGQARSVQIDIKPRMLGLRYPNEVNLCGDSRQTLEALIPYLDHKTDRSWREQIEEKVADWWQVMAEQADTGADPINPQYVFHELSPRLPANAIITADSGSAANWWARHLRMKESMMASLSGNLATMGPGVPYGIAAKFVHPDRPVIACVGDGAMQMNGLNGLITVEKYWQRWSNGQFIVLVLNNRDLNQVTWEQRVLAGDPKFEGSQNLPDFDYAGYGQMLGFDGITMRTPGDVASGWDRAFAATRPVVINAYVDPEVPPLPPHITFEQARNYMVALFKGEPHAARAFKQSVKGMAAKYKHHLPGQSGEEATREGTREPDGG
jgi:pyruvate dehydrogenase (quinone)